MGPNSAARAQRRALLIVNPNARRATHERDEALRALRAAGVACETVVTAGPGHATEVVRERAGRNDLVFTLGGDGTAMEVMTALADGGPPVAILGGGTGNVLVRSLGIPLRIDRAVPALLGGDETRIDLGRLPDGRHFAIGLGVGLDEAMIAGATPRMKRRFGVLAYVWSAVRATVRLDRFDVKLTVDGQVYERRASSVLIANIGSVLGGLIRLGGDIRPDDGLLHACVYSPRSFRDTVVLFARMLRGTAHHDPHAFYVAGRHFRLETFPPRRAQADGELLSATPIEVTVRPAAVRVLIPRLGSPK